MARNANFSAHVGSPNDDLIKQLCELAQSRDLQGYLIKKIAAHQLDEEVVDYVELFHVLGNRYADLTAKEGTKQHVSPIHELSWEVGLWYQQQAQTLTKLTPFLARAEMHRLDGFAANSQERPICGGRLFSVEQALD